MGKWNPCKRKDFISKLKKIGFNPPEPGGGHLYMRYGINEIEWGEDIFMNRQDVLTILAKHRREIEARFGVSSLALFGSIARDEAMTDSDVDILVTFVQTPGIFGFIELKVYLENLLQCSVDLVTRNALKKQFREQILKEALHAV